MLCIGLAHKDHHSSVIFLPSHRNQESHVLKTVEPQDEESLGPWITA